MSGKLDSGVIGDRIDVYEDRVSGVEGWAQYRYGEDSRGQSRELFMRAVTHVFPELGSVSTPGVRFMYRLAPRLASVHPAA